MQCFLGSNLGIYEDFNLQDLNWRNKNKSICCYDRSQFFLKKKSFHIYFHYLMINETSHISDFFI